MGLWGIAGVWARRHGPQTAARTAASDKCLAGVRLSSASGSPSVLRGIPDRVLRQTRLEGLGSRSVRRRPGQSVRFPRCRMNRNRILVFLFALGVLVGLGVVVVPDVPGLDGAPKGPANVGPPPTHATASPTRVETPTGSDRGQGGRDAATIKPKSVTRASGSTRRTPGIGGVVQNEAGRADRGRDLRAVRGHGGDQGPDPGGRAPRQAASRTRRDSSSSTGIALSLAERYVLKVATRCT